MTKKNIVKIINAGIFTTVEGIKSFCEKYHININIEENNDICDITVLCTNGNVYMEYVYNTLTTVVA